ncbi:TIGR03086 family metal-binding protein [Halostreptopolyspora alba]|uniref:TIGR03086 family protein n=1 Tax=Halostreptopolyspora alba TaxID=2487137 RepID=A0A3N0E937_9ACTN|nr:TIGR03086 family protein [Nocardiopsaceae bacterium YIM 96095]
MTLPEPPGALLGGIALLERAVGYTLGNLNLVTTEALGRSTPCARWELRALLGHMGDSFATLRAAAEDGRADAETQGTEPTAGAAETVRGRASQLLGAWAQRDTPAPLSVAGHPLSMSIAASAGAIEVAVHGWDVAQTCGHDLPVPPRLAEELLHLAPLLVTDADRPVRFAPPVSVPRGAGPSDRLVAFTGRRPGWGRG